MYKKYRKETYFVFLNNTESQVMCKINVSKTVNINVLRVAMHVYAFHLCIKKRISNFYKLFYGMQPFKALACILSHKTYLPSKVFVSTSMFPYKCFSRTKANR